MGVAALWPELKRVYAPAISPPFCRDLVNRMLAGESAFSLAQETSGPERPLHRRKHKALVDEGMVDKATSTHRVQFQAASKRIEASEKELPLVKNASASFGALVVAPPKGVRPLPKD